MELIKHAKNIHELTITGSKVKIGMFSDIHWDNPKCDWDLLRKDLDYCLKHSIPMMFNGDTFCLMQGKWDPRGTKSDIRPEHNNIKYLDSIVETAVDFFSPYAHLITVVGYGNHETSVIKRQETDILQRFVDLLNYKNGSNVQAGGYGGWFIVRQEARAKYYAVTKIKYFHGSGGGGIVTRGEINLTRALEMAEDFDVFAMGHIHENKCTNIARDVIEHHPITGYRNKQRQIHMMITGTYKEEYGDGSKGWHVERGAPPKPIGSRILVIDTRRDSTGGKDVLLKSIDSIKFPI
jgi:predicted phosphodiesterase